MGVRSLQEGGEGGGGGGGGGGESGGSNFVNSDVLSHFEHV